MVEVWEAECYICHKKNQQLELHHLHYETVGREVPYSDLIPLCHDCHQDTHIIKNKTIKNKKYKNKSFVKKARKRQATKKDNEYGKYYVVLCGREIGIFTKASKASKLVIGYSKGRMKKYNNKNEAVNMFKKEYPELDFKINVGVKYDKV